MTSALMTSRRLSRVPARRRASTAAIALAIIVILVAAPQAQQPSPSFGGTPAPAAGTASLALLDAPTDVDLLVGRSTILNVGSTIARVSLTVPDVADAMVTAPSQLLVHGKQPGTISLFVWDRAGAIRTFEVKVRRDLTPLAGHLKQLFPGEPITVMGSGRDIVLSGTVTSKYVIEKAADVAAGYVEKKENVVNLLQQQEGVASNQVLLRVRFAEVSRNALQELGGSLFSDGNNNQFGRVGTQQFPAPFFDQQQPMLGKTLVFSDYLNLFLFDAKNQIGAVVKALQGRGVFQSLAEPNLIALNGKEASFLAGGEFPYPVPQGQIGSFTIHFKEYGVRLSFTPTVLGGDLINLKLRPEVSSLDFNNAVIIEGFRIPALTSRRADTEVELRDGQTFAIAGLMNNTALSSMRKIPGIGDIPVLGNLFRSRAYQKDQTELVVMVTPQIVRHGSTGVSEALPALVEPYLAPPQKTHPNPDPYVGSPRYPANQPQPRGAAESPASTPPAPQAGDSATGAALAHPAAAVDPAAANALAPAPAPAAAPQAPAGAATRGDLHLLQQLAIQPGEAGTPPVAPDHGADVPPAPVVKPLTREERKAIEQARDEERKAAARASAEDARAAEQQRRAAAAAEKQRLEEERREVERRKAAARAEEKLRAEQVRRQDEARRQVERLEQDRARREAEVARKNAEKAAQAAYDAEMARQTGGGGR